MRGSYETRQTDSGGAANRVTGLSRMTAWHRAQSQKENLR
jgi:hypothetical protein